jgi:uncharacterized protein YqgC (DUF456 family)
MLNLLLSIIALFLLLLGLISMVTPIPGGTLLIALSFSVLICTSSIVQACVRYVRERNNTFNKIIFWLENKAGIRIQFIGTALAKTRPAVDAEIQSDPS